MKCPKCGMPAERDEIDIGVGNIPISGWYCFNCLWSEEMDGNESRFQEKISLKETSEKVDD